MSSVQAAKPEKKDWWVICGVPHPDVPRPACKDCKQRFTTEEDLEEHKKNSCWGPIMEFKCHECGITFSFEGRLKMHRKRQHQPSRAERQKRCSTNAIQRSNRKKSDTSLRNLLQLKLSSQSSLRRKISQDREHSYEAERRRQEEKDFRELVTRPDFEEALAGNCWMKWFFRSLWASASSWSTSIFVNLAGSLRVGR